MCDAPNNRTGDMHYYIYTQKCIDFVNPSICIFRGRRPAVHQDGKEK